MKRLARRQSILTVIAMTVTSVWVAVAYTLIFGESKVAGGFAWIGLVVFLPAVLAFCYEANTAVTAANRRIDLIERHLGFFDPDFLDDRDFDTPPHGIPTFDPKGGPR